MDDQGGSVALRGLGEGGWERGRGVSCGTSTCRIEVTPYLPEGRREQNLNGFFCSCLCVS